MLFLNSCSLQKRRLLSEKVTTFGECLLGQVLSIKAKINYKTEIQSLSGRYFTVSWTPKVIISNPSHS
jgi:hypothetical protein